MTIYVESGITPEVLSNKDHPNGYAGLDGSGLLKTAELPISVSSAVSARVYVDSFAGADPTGTTDSTTAINNAFTAAQAKPGGGATVELGAGVYNWSGLITVPDKCSFVGQGNKLGSSTAATRLKATAAGAQISYPGSGGLNGNMLIDGNHVATSPFLRPNGAQTTFVALDVINAAQDNMTIQIAQNDIYVGCSTQSAGRDNLVLDLGCGGILFDRFESWGATRWCVNIQQSSAPTGGYIQPSHIKFSHSIIENGVSAANPQINITGGSFVIFDDCISNGTGTPTVPTVIIAASTYGTPTGIHFRDCQLFGNAAQPSIIQHGNSSCTLYLSGRNEFTAAPAALDITAGGKVRMLDAPYLHGIPLTTSTAATEDGQVFTDVNAVLAVSRQTSGAVVEFGSIATDTGQRYRRYGDGKIGWNYGGSGFTFPATLQPQSDGTVGITPGLTVTGLTGATAASRYVGATSSGAPASGTFAVGDYAIDRTGTIWVCTAAGTPGTWQNVAGVAPGTRDLLQNGVHVPGQDDGSEATTTMTASQGYFRRFTVDKTLAITLAAVAVGTAATNNDNCDVGVYSATGTLLASNGGTAGKMNATGVQTISLSITLSPGTVYYFAFAYGTVGGTAAGLVTNSKAQGGLSSQLFGTSAGSPGAFEQGKISSVYPLPSTIGTLTGQNSVPKAALRVS